MIRRIGIFVSAVVLSLSCLAWGSYDSLTDWSSLPRLKTGVTAGLASSFDRMGENSDYSQYEYPSDLQFGEVQAIVKTLTGPGEITRFWMPHLTAKKSFAVKMYFDGETTPRINTTSDVLLKGQYGYMNGPLVTTAAGGQTLFEPIAFKQSLRIETYNKTLPIDNTWSGNRHYYQYSYHLFSTGGPEESYTGVLSASQQQMRNHVNMLLSNSGNNPAGDDPDAIVLRNSGLTVSARSAVSLACISGSGAIRKFTLKLNNPSNTELENLRVRVKYDGSNIYAVDVPVAHFFGAGFGRAQYKSLPLGTNSEDGFYSFWPMPYRQKISIELYNAADVAVEVVESKIEYKSRPVNIDECYFHAFCTAETTTSGQAYHQLLNIQGKGHYVGNILWLGRPSAIASNILEGDDQITADGNVLYGTGLEDAYNSGYYYNWVGIQTDDEPEGASPISVIRPFFGLLNMAAQVNSNGNFVGLYRVDQYRWHIPDFVPFEHSLNVKVENYLKRSGVDFGSTAFYYLFVPITGDANLDGRVDVVDLGILATNYGRTASTTWAMGDFNNDGKVDVLDLGLLATNYGFIAVGSRIGR